MCFFACQTKELILNGRQRVGTGQRRSVASHCHTTAHIYPFVKVNNLRLSEDVLYIQYMMGLLELSDDDIHSKSIIDTAKIEN